MRVPPAIIGKSAHLLNEVQTKRQRKETFLMKKSSLKNQSFYFWLSTLEILFGIELASSKAFLEL